MLLVSFILSLYLLLLFQQQQQHHNNVTHSILNKDSYYFHKDGNYMTIHLIHSYYDNTGDKLGQKGCRNDKGNILKRERGLQGKGVFHRNSHFINQRHVSFRLGVVVSSKIVQKRMPFAFHNKSSPFQKFRKFIRS